MVFRLLALIVLPLLAYFLAKSIRQRFSLSTRQHRLLFVLLVFLLVIGLMVIMGRLPIHFIIAPIGVAVTFLLRMLPTLLRLLPMWQMLKSRTSFGSPKSGGQTSTIRTEYFEMELEHDSGNMDGVVLVGNYEQRKLSSLSVVELLQLLQECNDDQDSSQVLQAFLDRNHPQWRERADAADSAGQANTLADDSVMTESLALEILGLSSGVSKEQITKAHRNLMQKMHPDRGGSEYLAKKINAAKDYLLEHL